MQDYIKQYWPVFFSVVTVVVSLITQWAVLGYRINSIEARQDRQGEAITTVQAQLSSQAAQYAALAAKLDSINDNVSYIRSRIDTSTK